MKKRFLVLILTLVFTFGLMNVAVAAGEVRLQFNGKTLPTEVPPVIKSGSTLVPVRVISESLGADVTWDPNTKKVTIVKNSDTVVLTVGGRNVTKNGEALADLQAPAQIINGKTFVPLRFVGEAFGAGIEWDGTAKTVKISHDEKRAGMTPEQLLEKSTVAMMAYDTYKFKVAGTGKTEIPKLPAVDMKITAEGTFRKPAEVYMKQTIGSLPAEITIETYTVPGAVYIKESGGKWKSMNIGFSEEIMSQMQNQDPAAAVEQMKKFGLLVTHGNEATIGDKAYYTLYVKFDADKYKALMDEIVAGMELPAEVKKDPNAEKLLKEMFAGMKFDLSYKGYVNKETLLLEKIDYDGYISMQAQGEALKIYMDMDMNMFDFGVPVTMPDLTS